MASAAEIRVFDSPYREQSSQYWFSGGKAKDGAALTFGGHKNGLGGEVALITDSEYTKDELQDYPVPHASYRILGNKRIGNTFGLDAIAFTNLSQNWSLGVGAGIYFTEYRRVAESNVTGWLYTQDKETKLRGAASLRLHFASNGFLLGVGVHSLRGGFMSIGREF